MAAELIRLSHLGEASLRWWRYGSRPVIMTPFLSHLVSPEKRRRVAQIVANPSSSAFDGAVTPWSLRPGFNNRLIFEFERAEQAGVDRCHLEHSEINGRQGGTELCVNRIGLRMAAQG